MSTTETPTSLPSDPPVARVSAAAAWLLPAWLWLCLLGVFTLITLMLAHQYRFAFDSDDAIRSVLARLAMDEGTLLPRHWIYANGDLWIISAYIFSVILYPWLGMGYPANVLASWLAWIFLSFTVFGTCLLIAPRQWRAALLAAVLTCAGISIVNFEYVIGQGSYSMYVALGLCLFGLAVRPPTISTRGIAICGLAFIAAALVCLSNSLRGNGIVVLPLLAGWFIGTLAWPKADWAQRLRRLHDPLIYSIAAGAITGSLLYHVWLRPLVLNFDASVGHGLASAPEMWQHLLRLPTFWFNYFQIRGSWASLGLLGRLTQCGAWALAIATILIPLWSVLTPRRHDEAVVRFAWIVLAAYVSSFGAMVASPLLMIDATSIRYATLPVYGSICLIAIGADRFARDHRRVGGALVFAMGLLALSTASSWRLWQRAETHDVDGSYAQRIALIQSLHAHRVGTVLTPYWNSHVLTVLSNGDVDGYPIYLADPGPLLKPYLHHLPRRVFHGRAGTRQAIVGSADDAGADFWKAAAYQLGDPQLRISTDGFTVWIYDHDIATAILAAGHEADAAVPAAQLSIKLSPMQFPRCADASACQVWASVTNTGAQALVSVGALPLRLGIRAIGTDGKPVSEAGRVDFPVLIAPGDTRRVAVPLPVTDDPKIAGYRLCLMQEHVAWLCERTSAGPAQP